MLWRCLNERKQEISVGYVFIPVAKMVTRNSSPIASSNTGLDIVKIESSVADWMRRSTVSNSCLCNVLAVIVTSTRRAQDSSVWPDCTIASSDAIRARSEPDASPVPTTANPVFDISSSTSSNSRFITPRPLRPSAMHATALIIKSWGAPTPGVRLVVASKI